jgi:histone deacetylase 11
MRDPEYLDQLQQYLPAFLQQIRPKIAFYNAGTDIYEHDPLGRLKISAEGVLARDLFVFETLVDAGIPVVMVLSGGYTAESYQLVARSVGEVWETWGQD